MRVLACILVLIFCVSQGYARYNETFVKYFVWPMAASTYSDHPDLCVHDNFMDSEFKRRIEVPCDILPLDNCVAFSAATHSEKAIIISFRGSTTTEVIMEFVNLVMEKPVEAFNGKAKVLEYFLAAMEDLWYGGIKDDFLTMKNAHPDYELWVTGHSLGAAMASLCATTIATTGLFDPAKIKLVTFGQPRIGNKDYAHLVDSTIPYAYRIIHKNDIVPTVPSSWFEHYTHHKSEVWYNNDMSNGSPYEECDEDESKKCSESVIDVSIPDHLFYYNKIALFTVEGCKDWNKYKNSTGTKWN